MRSQQGAVSLIQRVPRPRQVKSRVGVTPVVPPACSGKGEERVCKRLKPRQLGACCVRATPRVAEQEKRMGLEEYNSVERGRKLHVTRRRVRCDAAAHSTSNQPPPCRGRRSNFWRRTPHIFGEATQALHRHTQRGSVIK
eukprot:CAMPEP_0173117090 /NCGR_PEP_ID=MMETSP1102-20130122/49902_1 /TAXON_ID=49646 /ORGANISM="Geminigera sp., Strain Caron Lab Isolate" /LENGTH=139 /DNA_ID=CAMNT_0014021277 /DNA_START=327 /DNA_END=746 /DNA_ORIENTATION=+